MQKKKGRNRRFSLFFRIFVRRLRLDRDGLDLDQRALGQRADLHGAARGALAVKIPGVDLVDNGKIADVDHKNGRLDDVLGLAAGGFKHGQQVLDALLGLLCRIVGDKRAARRVKRELAPSARRATR